MSPPPRPPLAAVQRRDRSSYARRRLPPSPLPRLRPSEAASLLILAAVSLLFNVQLRLGAAVAGPPAAPGQARCRAVGATASRPARASQWTSSVALRAPHAAPFIIKFLCLLLVPWQCDCARPPGSFGCPVSPLVSFPTPPLPLQPRLPSPPPPLLYPLVLSSFPLVPSSFPSLEPRPPR